MEILESKIDQNAKYVFMYVCNVYENDFLLFVIFELKFLLRHSLCMTLLISRFLV